jgi:divalent metal cation (Fe/Co/Zn/Cd) transporter
MLGVLIMAVITAVIRIISYFYGSMENIPMLIPEPILYYAILVGIICYSLSLNYRYQNNKINNSSIVLKTEQKASFVDGTLSFGIAIGIIFLTRFPDDNGGNFIPYLADSLFVLILSSFLVKEPLTIIKEAIIELAGGTLQNEKTKRSFEKAIEESKVKNIIITDYHLSKNGSKYVILLNVDTKTATINKQDLAEMKKNIELKLKEEYPYLYIEIIPKI